MILPVLFILAFGSVQSGLVAFECPKGKTIVERAACKPYIDKAVFEARREPKADDLNPAFTKKLYAVKK